MMQNCFITNVKAVIFFNGRAAYAFTEQIPGWISLTYFNQGDGEFDDNEVTDSTVNWLELSVGGAYLITEDLWIVPDLSYTLTGTNSLADLGIGVYIGYHFMK